MFALIYGCFAIISLFGMWASWRRNPSYSGARTLKAVLFVLVAVGLSVSGIVLVVTRLSEGSPVVFGIALGASILTCTLVLIFAITSVTDVKTAKLAPGERALTTNRRKLVPWAKRWGVALLLCAVLALVPGTLRIIAVIVGGLLLFIGLIALPAQYYVRRKVDYALTALKDAPWVCWRYTPTEWQAWTEAEVARVRALPDPPAPKKTYKFLWYATSIWALFLRTMLPSWTLSLAVALGMAAGVALLIRLGKAPSHEDPEKRRAALGKTTPEAFFGDEGLFYADDLARWKSPLEYLEVATLEGSVTRYLYCRFLKTVSAGNAGSTQIAVEHRIPLPSNPERDLATLQSRLAALCPSAGLRLS